MNIQEGSYYIARNGELVGPMYRTGLTMYGRTHDGFIFGQEHITDTVDNAARKHVEGSK